MKKRFAVIALLLVVSLLTLSSCDLIGMIPGLGGGQGGEQGGENNPPEHTHSFVNGKCECGETAPDYQPPHEHSFVDGKCECGESDPNYQPPHDHVFVDGKCECGESDPNYVPPEEPDVLNPTTVYFVGDSTVCSFSDNYYYPRYGYGTQLANYLAPEATVVNLALSGRSSKSFISEANYETLKNSLKAGDYLIIGFGHNDEKSDDAARFTDATKPYTDETSFGYYLYNYYVKLALDAGATPILCTPVVRAKTNNDYSGNEGHVTATGDYAQAIRYLAADFDVAMVDLTAITAAEYIEKGYEGAKLYHAVTAGQLDTDGTTVVPNWGSVDKTHLNIYGAKFVAYRLALDLKNVNGIGKYILDDIQAPTEADLVVNPSYVYSDYEAPDLGAYVPVGHFTTTTEGWYGTAFGDTGGDPLSESNGYFATETSEGVFKVGNLSAKNKGKFAGSNDGFAFLFTQVAADKNFKISVTGTILEMTAGKDQTGFGLMLRDDVYLPIKDASILSNYVTAGFLTTKTGLNANFHRENATLNKGSEISSSLHAANDVFTASIERIGQSVTVSVTYGGQTYSNTYYDFDFLAKDGGYMYVGMFANRGTVVEFTELSFEITGTSQGA